MKRETSGTYLLWEPRRHERHLEGVAVRVKCVEGIGVHGAEHGENTARKLLTYCNKREATLGCAGLHNLLKLSVIYIHTGCNRRNGPDFGRVFLRSNYTDITQNTYIQS